MTVLPTDRERSTRDGVRPFAAWTMLAGGLLFLAGGPLHPKEDPPGVSVREHLRVMFEDPAWYPAHAVLLAGTASLAVSLVALVRGRRLAGEPRVHRVAVVAAVATSAAAVGALLHLLSAVDADAIAAHESTPITDVEVVVETITVPAFGLAIAALAVVGALTRTLGGGPAAVVAVAGGVGYALAGGTFLLTDRFDGLFPAAAGIALWAIAAAIGLLRHRPTGPTAGDR